MAQSEASANRDKILSRIDNQGDYIETINRTWGFVATVCLAAGPLAGVYDMKGFGSSRTHTVRWPSRSRIRALHTGDQVKVKFLRARDGE